MSTSSSSSSTNLPLLVCIKTPTIPSSETTPEELEINYRYAQLVTSVASMIPGYTIVTPFIQSQGLPSPWVTNKTVSPWGVFAHSRDEINKSPRGWRNTAIIEQKADAVWYGVDIPCLPNPKAICVSIANIDLLTDDQEIIDFVEEITSLSNPVLNQGDTPVIDLVSTVLDCHLKGYSGRHNIVFKYL
jgi:hypothetical protein